MAEIHYFDVNIAKEYGVNCAVILQNIWHWVRKNEANGTNFYDGNYWTYNSTKAFQDIFPYLSRRQIETALNKLRDDGIIITGNYNALKYDRTLWYAVTEKGKSILLGCETETHKNVKSISPVCEMDLTHSVNGFTPDVKPIPDINTDNKPDNKLYIVVVDYLNEKAGTKYRASSKKTQTCIHARLAEGFTIDDFKTVIDKKCAEWIGTEWEKFLRPETLFGTKFESYLNAKTRKAAVGVNQNDVNLDDVF